MANIGIKLAAKPHPLLLDFNEEFKGDTKESQSCSMVFFGSNSNLKGSLVPKQLLLMCKFIWLDLKGMSVHHDGVSF